jgi:uncharacterized protein (TIGR02145 family)
MKRILRVSTLALIGTGFISLANSCRNGSTQITVLTAEVRHIKQSSAVSGGIINAEKASSVLSCGLCWSTSADPDIEDNTTVSGSDTGSFLILVTGLRPGTLYYLRAFVISKSDTLYGDVIPFTTQEYGSVTDIDGNSYNTITIGTQTWMAQNLGTTRYNNEKSIPLVTEALDWSALTSHAFCWYKNDEATYKKSYGALYNGYTVNTGNLCPAGWHVPTDAEWSVLASFVGGENSAGSKLKETGTSRWVRPNSGATDMYGFSALPGGLRYSDGEFHDLGFGGYWWSSTQFSEARTFFRFLYYEDSTMFRFDNLKKNGFSIRCLRDN